MATLRERTASAAPSARFEIVGDAMVVAGIALVLVLVVVGAAAFAEPPAPEPKWSFAATPPDATKPALLTSAD